MKIYSVFIVAILLAIQTISAQIIPVGNGKLVDFTNAGAKFTVPDGKTWYISSVFSDFRTDVTGYGTNDYHASGITVFIKSLNYIELTNINIAKLGPVMFSSDSGDGNIKMPLILPAGTVIEFIICKGDLATKYELYNMKAFINYVEVSN